MSDRRSGRLLVVGLRNDNPDETILALLSRILGEPRENIIVRSGNPKEPPEAVRAGRLVRDLPVDLVANVDRTMILPTGVTKASGMQLALRALRLRADRFAAIGDAENDLPLLRDAALSGAVRNAEPRVVAAADYVCQKTFGAGVEEFVRGPVAHYLARAPPLETPE